MKNRKAIHFVGIGGIGMSAIASIALDRGERVTGSDIKESNVIQRLRDKGAIIYIGHRAKNVQDAKLVVVSSAIPKFNPEIREAKRKKIPIIPRALMLASLMKNSKNIIIAGMHGKTTTTSMISFLLEKSGFDPTLAIGGELKIFDGNAKLGKGEYFVAEADESDGSFLKLNPHIGVVTNVEPEHLDYYKNIQEIKNAFLQFLRNVKRTAVLCLDDENISDIIKENLDSDTGFKTYGIRNKNAELLAREIKLEPFGSKSVVFKNGMVLGVLKLKVPGIHNVLNALATIGVGLELGIEFGKISKIMQGFRNVRRRFETKGKVGGILILDDYAHHPTEIRMTLQATKDLNRKRIIVVFQPHRWTRTKFLGEEIGTELSAADLIFLTPVYSAGEKPIRGIYPEMILNAIKKYNKNVEFFKNREDIILELLRTLRSGDIIVTLGAGDVYKIGEELLERLKERKNESKDKKRD